MRLLALDLGTKTGWCAGTLETNISGTQGFQPQRFEGGGMRFLRFHRWLDELQGAADFDECVYEEVRNHKGVDAAHIYGGLWGALTSWCEAKKVPYIGVPVGTIKKFATGKGNASKEEVIAACVEWGYAPEYDNEADAIALFRQYASLLS